jgi:hypothetical protein
MLLNNATEIEIFYDQNIWQIYKYEIQFQFETKLFIIKRQVSVCGK